MEWTKYCNNVECSLSLRPKSAQEAAYTWNTVYHLDVFNLCTKTYVEVFYTN